MSILQISNHVWKKPGREEGITPKLIQRLVKKIEVEGPFIPEGRKEDKEFFKLEPAWDRDKSYKLIWYLKDNELNSTRQNFDNQLNATYTEQQRQINEANARHQREIAELRESQTVEVVAGFVCPQGHREDIRYYPEVNFVNCSTCPRRIYLVSDCSVVVRRISLEDFVRISGETHNERLRQLQQRIQEQECRNQEEASRIRQQISQWQSSINSQRWAEENRISQQYQQKENNLRSELQKRENKVQNAQQELNRLQEQFEQRIEQKTPPNFPWRS